MSDTQKRLAFGLLPATTPAAEPGLYKANESGNINTIIRSIHVANETAAAVTLTLSIVAASASDAVGKRIYSAFTIAGNGTLDWSGFLVINTNEWLAGFASASNALTIAVSGIVVT